MYEKTELENKSSKINPLLLKISFSAYSGAEYPELTEYRADVLKTDTWHTDQKLIGKLHAYKLSMTMVSSIKRALDDVDATAPYIEFFDGLNFKKSVLEAADTDGDYQDFLILNRLEILPEFRGRKYAGDVFEIVAESIGRNTVTAMIPFPLQLVRGEIPNPVFGEEWNNLLRFKSLPKDAARSKEKLQNYYQTFGFRKVRGSKNGIFVNAYWN